MSFYARWLGKHPVLTKSGTASLLMCAGDVVSQTLERTAAAKTDASPAPYDPVRTARMGLFGAAVVGPVFHRWFNVLDRIVPAGRFSAVGKVVVDQTVMAPCFLATFFASMAFLEGKGVAEAEQRVRDNFVPALLTNYTVWPAAQLLNFAVIPLPYRVLWLNMVGGVWNVYLSNRNAQSAVSAPVPAPVDALSVTTTTTTTTTTTNSKKIK